MLERTLVLVDTSYLLASFYNSWETGARAQLEIDLPEVVNVLDSMVHNQLRQPIHRQLWYDGIPDNGPHRYQRALRTCDGVQLRAGQLIEWGERRTQKAVDTRLVADMVAAAIRQQFSDFVLVSGDADMIPGVQEATENGIRVHLYGFGWDSMSAALRHACDSTTILDPREDFTDAMQLQVLEGPLPPVVRSRPLGDAEPFEEHGMTTVPNGAIPSFLPPTPRQEQAAPAAPPAAPPVAPPATHQATPTPTDSDICEIVEPTPVTPTAQAEYTPERDTPEQERSSVENDLSLDTPKPGPTKIREESPEESSDEESTPTPGSIPKPSMMAPRRKLRSRYVPLPEEVWTSAGFQTPFDVGQQYATWWYDNAATIEQRDQAHLLSGGGLPPEIDRPLLQFACETLHEYTLSETQRVNLRDGFHSGIRGVLVSYRRES
ncbi:NYN domain-containing protein [Corynebacterium testudinoris]|uniref:NYN domain-containing protein n=1 Tax=Corynebacterium testudinoris TaxID=136857 RepID=UPI001C8CCFEC|nr:NYN domain-containing protein [Corynebacterium testudinoris]MBX8995183.1 NYN domain-containing protein [Corynebacterium testudinoris]